MRYLYLITALILTHASLANDLTTDPKFALIGCSWSLSESHDLPRNGNYWEPTILYRQEAWGRKAQA